MWCGWDRFFGSNDKECVARISPFGDTYIAVGDRDGSSHLHSGKCPCQVIFFNFWDPASGSVEVCASVRCRLLVQRQYTGKAVLSSAAAGRGWGSPALVGGASQPLHVLPSECRVTGLHAVVSADFDLHTVQVCIISEFLLSPPRCHYSSVTFHDTLHYMFFSYVQSTQILRRLTFLILLAERCPARGEWLHHLQCWAAHSLGLFATYLVVGYPALSS